MSITEETEIAASVEWRRVCALICPNCYFCEFPRCEAHQQFFSREIRVPDQSHTNNNNDSSDGHTSSQQRLIMSCQSCEESTDTYTKVCRCCEISKSIAHSVMLSGRNYTKLHYKTHHVYDADV